MEKTIDWLKRMELLAQESYLEASKLFEKDYHLSKFLSELAEDEALHFHVLNSGSQFLPELKGSLDVSEATRDEVENILTNIKFEVAVGDVSRKRMLQLIVDAEFSEWNEIFLKVVRLLSTAGKSFQLMAAKIQKHEWKINNFLESDPDAAEYLEKSGRIPKVWKPRILVVGESEKFRTGISAELGSLGDIDFAETGENGIQTFLASYYDAVLIDISLPDMKSVDFFRKARKSDPNLFRRVIFLSFEEPSFSKGECQLLYLLRPTEPSKLKRSVRCILHS